MPHTPTAYIRGLGLGVPERVMANQEFEEFLETSDEWIVSRTGIRQRHVAAPGQAASDLGLIAAKAALADAGLGPEDVTHLFVATITPDTYCPSAATWLAHKLGLGRVPAMDVSAACSGFLYAMHLARIQVAFDPASIVLVVPADALTSRANWTDRATCVLFGDGAGACVVSGQPGPEGPEAAPRIVDILLASDGSLADLLTIKGGGSASPLRQGETVRDDFFIQMNGRDVYKHAVRAMPAIAEEVLAKNGYTADDVDLLVPHQANLRIIEAVGAKLGIERERVFVNVDKYGNTSAASVPIALTEARAQGRIKPGSLVLSATFGGGFTWGGALFRF